MWNYTLSHQEWLCILSRIQRRVIQISGKYCKILHWWLILTFSRKVPNHHINYSIRDEAWKTWIDGNRSWNNAIFKCTCSKWTINCLNLLSKLLRINYSRYFDSNDWLQTYEWIQDPRYDYSTNDLSRWELECTLQQD